MTLLIVWKVEEVISLLVRVDPSNKNGWLLKLHVVWHNDRDAMSCTFCMTFQSGGTMGGHSTIATCRQHCDIASDALSGIKLQQTNQ